MTNIHNSWNDQKPSIPPTENVDIVFSGLTVFSSAPSTPMVPLFFSRFCGCSMLYIHIWELTSHLRLERTRGNWYCFYFNFRYLKYDFFGGEDHEQDEKVWKIYVEKFSPLFGPFLFICFSHLTHAQFCPIYINNIFLFFVYIHVYTIIPYVYMYIHI